MINTVKHLPKVLQDVYELALICQASDLELEWVNKSVEGHYKETIVDLSSEYGLSMYEKLFKIVPNPNDSLSLRKFRIKSIFLNKLPYTVRWLYKRLDDIVGEGNYVVNIDHENYTLTVTLSGLPLDMLSEVQKQFRNNIPANMVMLIGNEANIEFAINYLTGMRVATHYQFGVEEINSKTLPEIEGPEEPEVPEEPEEPGEGETDNLISAKKETWPLIFLGKEKVPEKAFDKFFSANTLNLGYSDVELVVPDLEDDAWEIFNTGGSLDITFNEEPPSFGLNLKGSFYSYYSIRNPYVRLRFHFRVRVDGTLLHEPFISSCDFDSSTSYNTSTAYTMGGDMWQLIQNGMPLIEINTGSTIEITDITLTPFQLNLEDLTFIEPLQPLLNTYDDEELTELYVDRIGENNEMAIIPFRKTLEEGKEYRLSGKVRVNTDSKLKGAIQLMARVPGFEPITVGEVNDYHLHPTKGFDVLFKAPSGMKELVLGSKVNSHNCTGFFISDFYLREEI